MVANKDHFGITDHLLSKNLLDDSQQLILSSQQIIARLESQIRHCKSLAESLTVRKPWK
jgi:hypothetical protein